MKLYEAFCLQCFSSKVHGLNITIKLIDIDCLP